MELGKYIFSLDSVDDDHVIHPYHEIEELILNLLNPITDYPKLVQVNKYYHTLITNLEIYWQLKEAISFKHYETYVDNNLCNLCCIAACTLGYHEIAKLFYQLGNATSNPVPITEFKLEQFVKRNNFEMVKWLCELNPMVMREISFSVICETNNLEMIGYYFSPQFQNLVMNQYEINYGIFRGKIFEKDECFKYVCCNNHLEITKFLLSLEETLGKFNIRIHQNYIFEECCAKNHLEIAKLLISLEQTHGKIDIHSHNDHAFRSSCHNNNLEMAQWLYSLDNNFNISLQHEFGYACRNNQLDFAKWLYSIDTNINIREDDDYIFHECCNKKYVEMAQWLCTLCDKYILELPMDDTVYRSIQI